ncbi:MAG: hypothetical protein DMG21_22275 [Acidobacteria bacterium]|nr:MAG: hypothetical protein DMG21_22275 [Acidobacteriota bacterium]
MENKPGIPVWILCLLVLTAVMFAGVVYAGVVTYQDGVVEVSVHEKRAGGENIHLILPGVLVPAALHLVPKEKMKDEMHGEAREIEEWLPAARIAARELERIPDGPLVEVDDHHDHVRIFKRGGSLIVDVDDNQNTVHVSVPVALVRSVAENLHISSGSA